VPTIILFCCVRIAVEDVGAVVETSDLDVVLRAIAESDVAIVLIGPNVPVVVKFSFARPSAANPTASHGTNRR